jgi:hypothetical protein
MEINTTNDALMMVEGGAAALILGLDWLATHDAHKLLGAGERELLMAILAAVETDIRRSQLGPVKH